MRIRFGDYLLDEENFFLERAGKRVELRPKVFDLLVFLARHRRRVVRREELVEALWDTTVVGSGSLSGLVNELRQALGEDGRGTSSIRTVHARGYQFVAPVIDETESAADPARGHFVDKPQPKGSDLVARVAEDGVAGVVIEVSTQPQPEPDSKGIDDLSRHSARMLDLLELARREGFECHHLRAPDRSQVASIGFARSIVQALLAARGRSALRSALPLPARAWFESATVFEVAGGFSNPSGGPPDPIGTISHLLAELARKKPLVLVIDAMEDAEGRFAEHLVDVSNRLGSAPVLWAIPVAQAAPAAIGADWRPLLERQACFESWPAMASAVEGLDLALRRHGVEPLPPALARALAAHVGARGEGIECVARWLADRPEPECIEVGPAPEAADRAQDDARPVHRRMRRVEPAEREGESRWVNS